MLGLAVTSVRAPSTCRQKDAEPKRGRCVYVCAAGLLCRSDRMFNQRSSGQGSWATPVVSGNNTQNKTAVCSSWKAVAGIAVVYQPLRDPIAALRFRPPTPAAPSSKPPRQHTSLVVTVMLKWFCLADVLDKTFFFFFLVLVNW